MDLIEVLDVCDPFLIIGDDVHVFDTSVGVAVLEVVVGIFPKSLIASHPHYGEVVSVTR
jgi:hypothetical protein